MTDEQNSRNKRLREYFDGEPFGSQICRDVNKVIDENEAVRRPWWARLFR